MAELPNSLLLVSFFGTYTTHKTPASYVTLQTCLSVSVNANSVSPNKIAPNDKGRSSETEVGGGGLPDSNETKDPQSHSRACDELRRHLYLLAQAFPKFRLPAAPATRVLHFSQKIVKRYYGSVKWKDFTLTD